MPAAAVGSIAASSSRRDKERGRQGDTERRDIWVSSMGLGCRECNGGRGGGLLGGEGGPVSKGEEGAATADEGALTLRRFFVGVVSGGSSVAAKGSGDSPGLTRLALTRVRRPPAGGFRREVSEAVKAGRYDIGNDATKRGPSLK